MSRLLYELFEVRYIVFKHIFDFLEVLDVHLGTSVHVIISSFKVVPNIIVCNISTTSLQNMLWVFAECVCFYVCTYVCVSVCDTYCIILWGGGGVHALRACVCMYVHVCGAACVCTCVCLCVMFCVQ